ncbi:MAG: ketoacyl-ACP synthase III [Candidatus Marinimicrobia bacterium]|nr:ketoacyl-ACP synthase III [Candidatus Neomarinimicrobiota bacterium]MCF7850870.1 ketoacyl-ACP synthase III [Candidatus Neomarinimicrobiota bacterium]MCF7904385.1 ketoacyl-ACP synthase III [Candidatus Neomarinimicrobiota bacterium]
MIRAAITGVSSYVPEKVLTNFDLEKMVDTNDEWIVSRTGIRERHIAAENEASSDMAVKAIEKLLKETGTAATEIEAIIVATVTPDMMFPSTAALIQEKIGANRAWGYDLSGACSGFLFALKSGRSLIETGHKKVIVVGVDTMSAILDYTDRNTCILFGDGAGAVLLEPTEDENFGIIDEILRVDGTGAEALFQRAGGSRRPASHETVDAREHFIYQDGKTVFKRASTDMANVSLEVLEKNHVKGEDVGIFIPHQANKRIIDVAARKAGFREDQVLLNIDKYGNTTAATIPLGLDEVVKEGRIKAGDLVLFAAFGAGYTWGSTLLRYGPEKKA